MVQDRRHAFISGFSQQRYQRFVADMEAGFGSPIAFHICETPVFFDRELTRRLISDATDLLYQSLSPAIQSLTDRAIPPHYRVPGPEGKPHFVQVDFAITRQEGALVPKLIELQGFPSLYAFQLGLSRHLKTYSGMTDVSILPDGMTEDRYQQLLTRTLTGGQSPEETVLLEIDPDRQKTFIDFHLTRQLTGIRIVDLLSVKRDGNRYVYKADEKWKPLNRVYNRVIFDELDRKGLQSPIDFGTVDHLTWITHPNWYYRISKFLLPLLQHPSVPACWFLDEAPWQDLDLSRYVLKPLFSFAGTGVKVTITADDIRSIPEADRHDYILQEKVAYEPILETLDDPAKLEVRVMFLPDGDDYVCTNFLVRVSKGAMMGVDFNKNRTWVGSAGALFLP